MTRDVASAHGALSLEQKVGQMFLLAFAGPTPADAAVMIREHHIGGCYLSNENLTTPGQAVALTTALQALAEDGPGIPLLLAADQEGAWAVLTAYGCPGPGNMALGAAGSDSLTRDMYRVFGEELRAIGLHMDLAPVADANTTPENSIIGMRSFGERPAQVARQVTAAIAGLHDAGVGATAKHFPGHGDTRVDSHRHFPVVDRGRDILEANELLPFRAAVAAGVDIVMTSHIFFPALDPTRPATLSRAILTGLLRDEMKFPGVVLTDSFNMGSIRRSYESADAAVQAVRAGADMIMLAEERYGDARGTYLDDQRRLVRGVAAAVRRGDIEPSRIDDAVSRILALKQKYVHPKRQARSKDDAAHLVGSREHRDVEQRAAEAAIVVVQDRRRLLPLRLTPEEKLVVASAADPEGYQRMDAGRGIGPNIVERPAQVALREITRRHARTVAANAPSADLEAVLSEAAGAAAVVVVTEKYPLAGFDFPDESQHRLIARLVRARGPAVIILGCRDPYELAALPEVDVYVSAMGYRAASVTAAVRVLFGEISPRGALPVSIPGLSPAG